MQSYIRHLEGAPSRSYATPKALVDPALAERLFPQGSDPIASTPQELLEKVKPEHQKSGKIMSSGSKI